MAWLQVMLRQDNGEYACVAEDERRYNLGEAKEEMMAAMGLNTEVEGSAMQFLRRGYRVIFSRRYQGARRLGSQPCKPWWHTWHHIAFRRGL